MGSQRGRKVRKQGWMVGYVASIAIAGIQPAQAQLQNSSVILVSREGDEEVAQELQQADPVNAIPEVNSAHVIPAVDSVNVIPEAAIDRLDETEHPASTVEEWIAQLTIQITGVQINPTEAGFEILLETETAQQPDITTSVVNQGGISAQLVIDQIQTLLLKQG